MGTRNGLLYRPTMQNTLAESIPGLLKSLKIQSLAQDHPYRSLRWLTMIR
jgi:hypothetical protein